MYGFVHLSLSLSRNAAPRELSVAQQCLAPTSARRNAPRSLTMSSFQHLLPVPRVFRLYKASAWLSIAASQRGYSVRYSMTFLLRMSSISPKRTLTCLCPHSQLSHLQAIFDVKLRVRIPCFMSFSASLMQPFCSWLPDSSHVLYSWAVCAALEKVPVLMGQKFGIAKCVLVGLSFSSSIFRTIFHARIEPSVPEPP